MEFCFKIKGDRLIGGTVLTGNSGNVNTYTCGFEIENENEFAWICVFKKGEDVYQQAVVDRRCTIPKEVLENMGEIHVGCYGTCGEKRISTNWLRFDVAEGAYCDATMPTEPTPELWEVLIMNSLPYIGENGNWYTYDRTTNMYNDSGKPARGEKGDKGETGSTGENGKDGHTPVRGTDYWTEEDKNEISHSLEEKLNFEERLARVVGNSGNSLNGRMEGKVVTINDISPKEHLISGVLKNKNLIPYPYYDTTKTVNGITFTDNGDGTVTVNGTATADASFYFLHSNVSSIPLIKGKTYTLSGKPNIAGVRLVIQDIGYRQNIEGTAVANYDVGYYGFIRIASGTVCENIIFKPTLVEGNEADEYIQYVHDFSMVTVNKCGKNLIPYPYYESDKTVDGITFSVSDDGTITANGTATANVDFRLVHASKPFKLEKGEQYTVSGCEGGSLDGWRIYVQNIGYNQSINVTNGPVIFAANYEDYYAYIKIANGTVCNNVKFKPLLEKGSVGTEYEKYTKETYVADADGKIQGMTAVYPVTTISTDTPGLVIECEYNRDINKAYEELVNAIISLGGNV